MSIESRIRHIARKVFPSISPQPRLQTRRLLDATDAFAVQTVRAGQGGPFGSSIGVYNSCTAVYTPIGEISANAVLKKGIGSAHAESENLSPETIKALEDFLIQNFDRDNCVIHASSGESCVACTAKQEITAQHLVSKSLLTKGNYFVFYGATYEDTQKIAEFNDLPYLLDMQKGYGKGAVMIGALDAKSEGDVALLMHAAAMTGKRVAAVRLLNGRFFTGRENLGVSPLETAEAVTLRMACAAQKDEGAETPWDLNGASLYIMAPEAGGLTMAEALWANVARIVPVWSAQWERALPRQEAPITTNPQTYAACASRKGSDFIHVVCMNKGFPNMAQHVWRSEVLSRPDAARNLYNGAKIT